MNGRPRLRVLVASAVVAAGLLGPAAAAGAAPSAASVQGAAVPRAVRATSHPSAFQYLDAHYPRLDRNWGNFSIATRLLADIQAAGGGTYTAVLFRSGARATVLLPTDNALRLLLTQVTGHRFTTERAVLARYETMVKDDVDGLLGYGIVRGRTLTASAIIRSAGQNLRSVWTPRTIHVAVYHFRSGTVVSLWDKDRRLRNPHLILSASNLNRGASEVIHGIDRVALGFRNHIARSWFDPNQYDLAAESAPCEPGIPCHTGGTPPHGG